MYRELGFVALRLICHGPAINASLLQWSKSLVRCAPSHPLDLEFARLLSIEECVRDYRGAIGSEEWRDSWAACVAFQVGLHSWRLHVSQLGCMRGIPRILLKQSVQ